MRVVCIDDEKCDNSLVLGKIYEVVDSSIDTKGYKYYSLAGVRSEWYQWRFKIISFNIYLTLL